MHVIIILAAMAVVCVAPFMSGSTNGETAYLNEQQADASEALPDDESTESETHCSSVDG